MTIAIFSLVFLGIGIWLGYVRSERKFGRMVDDSQIVFRYEVSDEISGWDGTDEALESIREWLASVPLGGESDRQIQ